MKHSADTFKSPIFGYKSDPRIVPLIRRFAETNPLFPTLLGLTYIFSIFSFGFCVDYFTGLGVWQAIIAYPLGLLMIARQLRMLEFLIHDGSHFSWDRKNRKLNDFLTNMIAAYPLFVNLKIYRKDHINHHKLFRTHLDSCFQRVLRLGFYEANKHTGLVRKKMLMKCFPRFIVDYIVTTIPELANLKSGLIGLLWHVVFAWLPIYFFTQSYTITLVIWGIYFLIPYLFFLPCFSFFNDVQDHLYSEETEFLATTSSLGILNDLFFAPINTGYHLLHHLFPATPLWACKRFHKELMTHDAFYATHGKYYMNPFGSIQQSQDKSTSSSGA